MRTPKKKLPLKKSDELESLLDYINEYLLSEHPANEIPLDYFIYAILEHPKCEAYKTLDLYLSPITIREIKKAYLKLFESTSLIAIRPDRKISFSDELEYYLKCAEKENDGVIFNSNNERLLTSDCVLLAILNKKNNEYSPKVLKTLTAANLTYPIYIGVIESKSARDELNNISQKEFLNNSTSITMNIPSQNKNKTINQNPYLSKFTNNLNDLVKKGKIDRLVGRDNEINKINNVLNRRKKNNVILVGESGVGKTAIIEGLAYKIETYDVPNTLQGYSVYSLNSFDLLSGITMHGEIENRVKGLLGDLKKDNKNILVIDDIHTLLNEHKNNPNVYHIISKILMDDTVRVIASTNYKEYKSIFNGSTAFSNLFQKIVIEPSTVEETKTILKENKSYYETFYNITVEDNIIDTCVTLSNRYVTDKCLPESAINIIDLSMSRLSSNYCETEEALSLRKEISELHHKNLIAKQKQRYDESDIISQEIKIITGKYKAIIDKNRPLKGENTTLTEADIAATISEYTGIPISKMSVNEKRHLSQIDDLLKKSIIGQDEAIEKVCKIIKRNKIGLAPHTKTMGNIFLLGSTGCGKTLLAKKIAEEIFGDESYLVRFDMSEYSDKMSISRLIGAAPGYVGFDEGGQLTEAIKKKKYCVLLFDEIEKADKSIYNLFLQLFDEGHLTDSSGYKVDFKNVIVFMTSNIGAESIVGRGNSIGFNANEELRDKGITDKALKSEFPPEFLNRLDDIIYFNKLNEEDYNIIIDLELKKLIERLKAIGYNLSYDKETICFIYNKIKDKSEYGARPILRIIQDDIENKITELILLNEYTSHDFIIKINDDDLNIE